MHLGGLGGQFEHRVRRDIGEARRLVDGFDSCAGVGQPGDRGGNRVARLRGRAVVERPRHQRDSRPLCRLRRGVDVVVGRDGEACGVRGSSPAIASSIAAASATERANIPTWSRLGASASIP